MIVRSVAKTKLTVSRACTELKMLPISVNLDYVILICEELGDFRRGTHRAVLFHTPDQDVRMTVHDDDFVCLSYDDGLKHIRQSSQIQIHSERHRNTWIRRFRRKKVSVVETCVSRVGVDPNWTVPAHSDPDLRHAPLIISESGCNTNTEAVSTPRERNYKINWCLTEDRVRF